MVEFNQPFYKTTLYILRMTGYKIIIIISMYLTLEQVKQHLYIPHDHDDLLLADYITVAEDAVCRDLNIHCLDEIVQPDGLLPACVLQAALLLVGGLYNARESISFVQIHKNPVYNYLLSLYRNYDDTLYIN